MLEPSNFALMTLNLLLQALNLLFVVLNLLGVVLPQRIHLLFLLLPTTRCGEPVVNEGRRSTERGFEETGRHLK